MCLYIDVPLFLCGVWVCLPVGLTSFGRTAGRMLNTKKYFYVAQVAFRSILSTGIVFNEFNIISVTRTAKFRGKIENYGIGIVKIKT